MSGGGGSKASLNYQKENVRKQHKFNTQQYYHQWATQEDIDYFANNVDAEGNPEKDRYQWNEETVSWDFVG